MDKCNVTRLNLSELSLGCRSLQTGFKHFLRLVCRWDCQLAGNNFRLVLIRDSYHKLQYFSKCPAFLVLVNSLNPGVSVVCLAWSSGWEYSSERLVADWRFDSWAVVIFKLVFMSLVVVLIGQFCRDVIGLQDFQIAVTGSRNVRRQQQSF